MRVLFTSSTRGPGHFHPLVPIARALANAGHEVAVAGPAPLAEALAHLGLRHFPAGLAKQFSDVYPQIRTLPATESVAFIRREVFAGLLPRAMVPDLLALAAAWPPDLIVREEQEYGGCVAAEILGRPHAAVGILAIGDTIPRGLIAAPLAALRARPTA